MGVKMEGKMAMDGANEMQAYLDSHSDLPKEITVAKIVELSTSHAKAVFLPPKDPEANKVKLQELYDAQKQEEAPDLMTNFAVSKIAGKFVQLKTPSLSLPTKVK